MKDPCKSSKCISYPICVSKTGISCKKFQEYLNWFVEKNINQINCEDRYLQHSIIWGHLKHIFPNLKKISYQSLPHSKKRRVYERSM